MPAKKTRKPPRKTRKPGGKKLAAVKNRITAATLSTRLREYEVKPTVDRTKLLASVQRINLRDLTPFVQLPTDVQESIPALRPEIKRFHGTKVLLTYFPGPAVASPCADMFGYMSPPRVRSVSKLPVSPAMKALMETLGDLMGDPGREPPTDSIIPAGYTYFGQFVDHDVTFDVSSSIDIATDANTIHNLRSPSLDLDSMYGRGPAMDPFLYDFPTAGPTTAIKMKLGINTPIGPGGPGGTAGFSGMVMQTDFDVPRIIGPAHTAIIGDPRNDENLIVVQFHQTMLRFHNAVVDMLILAGFPGDNFVEAKKIVTYHYQWAVVNDFLKRICGAPAVNQALSGVSAAVGSSFRMPVEFAVAAYRFGHSMIRDFYWLSFVQPFAQLPQVFAFNRDPNLPVFSNWVVDFNAFFDTGVFVPVNNKAKKIDSVMAVGLENLPGFSGLMAVLATRNLRRGLALGLPSGQAMARWFGIAPMTAAQLTGGLPANEVAVLNSNAGVLLKKTPLWYYVLREAMVLRNGDQLGSVGARIVADTFVRILKRDGDSYLRATGGFTPILPSATPGDFTVADLVVFAGVTQP